MHIGVVCPRWFPDFGGAEIYVERLGRALVAAGHGVRVVTASAERPTAGPTSALPTDRRPMPPSGGTAAWESWYDAVEDWIGAGRFTHVIMNPPLTRGSHLAARRLYDRARAAGARVGCFHHDLGRDVATELARAYLREGDWTRAARAVSAKAAALLARHGAEEGLRLIESPVQFGPDFVISGSAWSDRFIDPRGRCARLVLHPRMDAAWHPAATGTPTADVGFINPLPHKGVDRLIAAMGRGPAGLTYRVLNGGYGDALLRARDALEAAAPGRVECVPVVADVRDFYAGVRVVMFASLYEGYGMAAVEPGFVGTPSVATDYPSIGEAVGDGARRVPYDADDEGWVAAIEEVLAAREAWSGRALARAAELLDRQDRELDEALAFLLGV